MSTGPMSTDKGPPLPLKGKQFKGYGKTIVWGLESKSVAIYELIWGGLIF